VLPEELRPAIRGVERRPVAGAVERHHLDPATAGLVLPEDIADLGHQLGRHLYEGFTQRKLEARWARVTNNLMHWGYGVAWATAYGIAAGSSRRPRVATGPPFGAFVWLTSYVVMPAAGLYKPIWEYDGVTLWKDLTPHLAYGTAVAAWFRVLSRGVR